MCKIQWKLENTHKGIGEYLSELRNILQFLIGKLKINNMPIIPIFTYIQQNLNKNSNKSSFLVEVDKLIANI